MKEFQFPLEKENIMKIVDTFCFVTDNHPLTTHNKLLNFVFYVQGL